MEHCDATEFLTKRLKPISIWRVSIYPIKLKSILWITVSSLSRQKASDSRLGVGSLERPGGLEPDRNPGQEL
jgi:hypothetical protein